MPGPGLQVQRENVQPSAIHPERLTWNINEHNHGGLEDHFPSQWMICRFHVDLPGCSASLFQTPSPPVPNRATCEATEDVHTWMAGWEGSQGKVVRRPPYQPKGESGESSTIASIEKRMIPMISLKTVFDKTVDCAHQELVPA